MFEKKYTLLRSQKRRVYEILREAGLEPAEFSWLQETIAGSLIVSRLDYRYGDYYFQFSSYEMSSWCLACPGTFRSMDYSYPKTWEQQEQILAQWAKVLKTELESSDPWEEVARYRLALDEEGSPGTVNEPIPAVEADQIGRALARLGEKLTRDLGLSTDPARVVQAKLEYLAEAARRERSRDWMYLVLGVCTATAVTLALDEERTALLWETVRSELGAFVRLQPARGKPAGAKSRILGIRSASRARRPDEVPEPS
jgi:hypothetical protein